ncbi:SDR family oxidoreductase [Neobacillus drentensis]|uniref:SDR family oxidoreductase n=1 Tax=Neobacillus drentensis TaxID=220684 RepID=UPI002FFE0858
MKILITGSTGMLGTALINQLTNLNFDVKLTSRRKPVTPGQFEWVYSDLLTGDGLEEAVKDVEVVIHAATSPLKKSRLIDVSGLERFLTKLEDIKHFIYPSIVGIEDIPFKYYKLKCEAEDLLKNSSIPYTIVRATQFHDFVDHLLLSKPLFKRYIIPGSIKFQSVDVGDFAKHLIELIEKGPQGRTDDFGGPEIMSLREMAKLKIHVNNVPNKIVSISLPGKLYKSLVNGKNTNKLRQVGKLTFEEYLSRKLE